MALIKAALFPNPSKQKSLNISWLPSLNRLVSHKPIHFRSFISVVVITCTIIDCELLTLQVMNNCRAVATRFLVIRLDNGRYRWYPQLTIHVLCELHVNCIILVGMVGCCTIYTIRRTLLLHTSNWVVDQGRI